MSGDDRIELERLDEVQSLSDTDLACADAKLIRDLHDEWYQTSGRKRITHESAIVSGLCVATERDAHSDASKRLVPDLTKLEEQINGKPESA